MNLIFARTDEIIKHELRRGEEHRKTENKTIKK